MGGWDYYPMVHAADSEASSHKIYSMLSKLCTICQAVGRREGGREGGTAAARANITWSDKPHDEAGYSRFKHYRRGITRKQASRAGW